MKKSKLIKYLSGAICLFLFACLAVLTIFYFAIPFFLVHKSSPEQLAARANERQIYLEKQPNLVITTMPLELTKQKLVNDWSIVFHSLGNLEDSNITSLSGFLKPTEKLILNVDFRSTLKPPSYILEATFSVVTDDDISSLSQKEINTITLNYFLYAAKLPIEEKDFSKVENWINENLFILAETKFPAKPLDKELILGSVKYTLSASRGETAQKIVHRKILQIKKYNP